MRIAITGLGLWSPVGREPSEVLSRLIGGESGIGPIRLFDAEGFTMRTAAEVLDFDPGQYFDDRECEELDRATQLAIIAARDAWRSAGFDNAPPPAERTGLSVGVSGAGQFQNTRFTLCRMPVFSRAAGLYSLRNLPHFQTTLVAERLGIAGPAVTFTCASAGSAIAIGYAAALLRSGKCEAIIAGGSEIITIPSAAGMDSLHQCAAGPCSPFSGTPGMTLGEGAAFLVLEPAERAARRGARVLAEIAGWGSRSDAYDAIGTDPSGTGLARSMRAALSSAGVDPGEIGWIKASGTSNREQDMAETLAVREVFDNPPPVSSLEGYLGHANGAAPVLGIAAALLCRSAGVVPPTLNFGQPRAGCVLDYVPNHPRQMEAGCFLANSIAFGGGSAAIVIGEPRGSNGSRRPIRDTVAITGIGIVSPAGSGINAFRETLQLGGSGVGEIDRWDTSGLRARRAGLIRGNGRAPVDVARLDLLQRYAVEASAQAFTDARFAERPAGERIGVVTGLSRGSAQAHEQFSQAISTSPRSPAVGKLILRMGRFHVTSTLTHRFGLKGIGATISEGVTAGLHALIHACELLSQDDQHDAMLVVAADELGSLTTRMFEELDWLAAADPGFAPYSGGSEGMILGEGAGAFIIERAETARRRGARIYATVGGTGVTQDHQGHLAFDQTGHGLQRATELALDEAKLQPEGLDVLYGHGRGLPAWDSCEIRAFANLTRAASKPVCCVNGNTGVAEAASGCFSVAAALLGMESGEAFPIVSGGPCSADLDFVRGGVRRGEYRKTLVAGSTESGNNAAIVLRTGTMIGRED